jgi:phosphate starvation-inducible PhoH-like protein
LSSNQEAEIVIALPTPHIAQWLCGLREENLAFLESILPVTTFLGSEHLTVKGEPEAVRMVEQVMTTLLPRARDREVLTSDELRGYFHLAQVQPAGTLTDVLDDVVARTYRGKPVKTRSANQLVYVRAIEQHTLTFGLGPAGTGKTFLAVALAVRALSEKRVSRIILTRPAVEAGESLGFLPGDFQAKVDPYFRPLYDALYELMDAERVSRHLERGMIEVAPLAYMRGRTLTDAFIILDEAQNTTGEQMKMFLTRMGAGSRVVVTGDQTQIDLPRGKRSALHDIQNLLAGVHDVAFVRFDDQDVVRHDLVRRIVQAYAAWEARHPS